MVIVGSAVYPEPGVKVTEATEVGAKSTCVVASVEAPPPVKVTVGTEVYPVPAPPELILTEDIVVAESNAVGVAPEPA